MTRRVYFERTQDEDGIVTAHVRGRPKAKDPGTTLTVWMPASEYDQLVREATASRSPSLSAYVRRRLTRRR